MRGINAGARELTRSDLDTLTELAKQHGAKGLVWAFVQDQSDPAGADGPWRSPIAKFLDPAEIGSHHRTARRDSPATCCSSSPTRRPPPTRPSARCGWRWRAASTWCPRGVHDIRWVVQFPMFTFKPDEQRWDAEHHPFTAPATAAGAPATAADMDDPGDAAVALL